jgi:FtsP/CotA-like multicopper oxidase with cupredoxin domain
MSDISRRGFLAGTSAFALTALPGISPLAAIESTATLTAAPMTASFFGTKGPSTEVWAYGSTPGPVLRVKQGERLRVPVTNNLPDPTTVHWHGLRIDNAMDGVPFLTQPPIRPGETFSYDFPAKDAGTFWYHPHVNSAEQVGRGLSGALIVEEAESPAVDRDLVWIVDDWRIDENGSLAPFGSFHDLSHGGRMGNVATFNGKAGESLTVRSGERIRMRLINAANARVFGLRFGGTETWRIAIDGHPVPPTRMGGGLVVVAPGGRVDLILDMTGKPGERFEIVESYYRRHSFTLAEIVYSDETPLRKDTLPWPKPLAANPVALPDLAGAERHAMIFEGGAMGGLRQAELRGETFGLRDLAAMGLLWAVNGRMIPPMTEDDLGEPMVSMKRGKSYIMTWTNRTAFDHPIHLHGYSFHLLSQNGRKLQTPMVMDTVLIQPDQSVDVAFVADNPGNWALHCHVLEHAEAGMMGYVEVA